MQLATGNVAEPRYQTFKAKANSAPATNLTRALNGLRTAVALSRDAIDLPGLAPATLGGTGQTQENGMCGRTVQKTPLAVSVFYSRRPMRSPTPCQLQRGSDRHAADRPPRP